MVASLPAPTRLALGGLALCLLLPAWQFAHLNTTFIESPFVVALSLPGFLAEGSTWTNIGVSLGRVSAGLLLGIIGGFIAAFLMVNTRIIGDISGFYVIGALRTPSAIAAIVSLAIFKGSEAGYVLVVAFITFPYMAIGLRDGLATKEIEIEEMARIYHFDIFQKLQHVWIPSIAPFIFSALRNAHALAWKVIVVAEIFGAARVGFGAKFEHAWIHLDMIDVHLWLLVFMTMVLFFEYGVIRNLERIAFRWR